VSDTGSPEPLVKYVLSDGISQAFLPFRFVDVTVITDHDLFWNYVPACPFTLCRGFFTPKIGPVSLKL
jgi:hypothetical protein